LRHLNQQVVKYQIEMVNPAEIRFIQSALNQILGTQHSVDRIWGSNSRKQVKAFQTQQGLQVDGKNWEKHQNANQARTGFLKLRQTLLNI
tara:strand:+ start:33318 stop:33587 length:270 start_codon:yes stop_codon:yes gene_type:complete